jgi:acetyltransferase-like isoleucine patch superfamily enzyme
MNDKGTNMSISAAQSIEMVGDSRSSQATAQLPDPGLSAAQDSPVALTVEAPMPEDLHEGHMPPTMLAALRKNGPAWAMKVAKQMLVAKWQLRKCTSIGKWVRVRGKVIVRNEGTIKIADRVRFRSEAAISELVTWKDGRIEIGEGTTINYGSSISAAGLVKIGKDCLIGTYVNVMDCTFHNVQDRSWDLEAEPVVIGDRVWLGNRCMIMKGVTIGDGAVVAACSLVTRNVPPNTMVVGVPARVVQHL